MKNVPIWFITTFVLSLFCFIFSRSIYNERNDIKVLEETLQGDISVMEGMELELSLSDHDELWWGIGLKYDQKLQTDVEFKPLYNVDKKEDIKPQILAEDNVFDMLDIIIKDMEDGISVIRIADYIEYMSIEFELAYADDRISEFQGDNNLYKIKVPDYAFADIYKEYNSTGVGISGVPKVRNDLPSIVIEDRMYFTISNLEMASWHLYNSDLGEDENIEYSLTSGILSIPFKEDKKSKPSYSDIVIDYPMDIDHTSEQYIIGMESMEIEKNEKILLITMEENKLYLHLYDPNQKALIMKKEIGIIPENKTLIYMDVIVQDNYLILHSELDEENIEDGSYERYCVAAAYEFKDDDFICLLENEYLSKLDNNLADYWYISRDVNRDNTYYANGKLYILSMNNGYKGDYNTGLLVIVIDDSDILYFANIRNSMEEDYTIALSYPHGEDENMKVFSNDRSIDIFNLVP